MIVNAPILPSSRRLPLVPSISWVDGTDVLAPFETDQKWTRPTVKQFDPRTDALSSPFMLYDVDGSVSAD